MKDISRMQQERRACAASDPASGGDPRPSGSQAGHHNWLALATTICALATPVSAAAVALIPGSANAAVRGIGPSGPVVQVETGRVRGLSAEGVEKFLGIPYAAVPVGELRWKPPASASRWSGTRDGTKFGSACPQAASENGPEVVDEDCLFVNVFRPRGTRARGRLPVYLFIHGGGNLNGSSTQHDATKFAQDNQVIVVTMNYRLGVLGFLGLPSLREESTDNSSGNYGLLDQQAAMRWTQRNVGRFGGDPRHVTLGGESAGGRAVCYHLTSPATRGLFRAAVMESGGCNAPSLATVEASGSKFAAAAGCPDASTAPQCLRSKSPQELFRVAASTPVTAQPAFGGPSLPRDPVEAIRSGQWSQVPVLIGANHDEQRIFLFLGIGGKLPITESGYIEQIRKQFGQNADRVLAEYPLSAYPNPSIALSTVLNGVVGRSCRAMAIADLFSKTASVWHFEFNDRTAPPQFPPPADFPLEATHASELQYFFAFDSTRQLSGPQVTLSNQMQAYWTRFAATLDPGPAGGVPWPRWKPEEHQSLSLQTEGNTVRTNVADDHKCAFWAAMGMGLP